MTDDIHEAVRDLVPPAAMTTESIVDELTGEFENLEVRLVVADMIDSGELEEHPEMSGVYRLP